ncbi:hypothetical protein KI688_000339 [Linnemannia hyalina]|uniref:Association with the SNF1 complex (ASC) domain-containing protein n=1 Tax=Linnemannia hyalina TaxID=64524 RepID=A0A9P7Y627_9FUNG|nr:hypothetical protein KI688_000339 [Linnemannia hyalina]
MGNAPSQPGNESNEAADSVDAVTFTNGPYQKHPQQPYQQQQQQQHQQHQQQQNQQYRQHDSTHLQQPSYMTSSHQRQASSPGTFTHSSPPQGSIHPSTIPIASVPVDAAHRRFPSVREQYLNDSPAGSSPLDSDSSYPHVLAGGHSLGDPSAHPPRSSHSPKGGLPGGGPRRRASSLVSGQAYGQYADTFNEQALVASAAQQDKLEQRLHTSDGRPSYRNSARVSRAFELEPLKSLDNAHDDSKDGNVPTIITWSQGGTNVYVTGTFNNWKQKFIVDDEWKCSTELSAATDAEGNLVNFLEVDDEEQDELEGGYDTPINGSPVGSYTDHIPAYALSGDSTPSTSGSDGLLPLTAISANDGHGSPRSQGSPTAKGSPSSASSSSSKMFDSTSSISNEPPPGLPPHLEKVILNNVPSKEDNSVLPVPDHVVLNHLYACSVKEGVLSISVTARYRKKYITTVFIKPVVTDA